MTTVGLLDKLSRSKGCNYMLSDVNGWSFDCSSRLIFAVQADSPPIMFVAGEGGQAEPT